ncbi:hypothetical protein COV05_01665 [Candidatus Uhrbacteria bacterium CG10_big_fil_rev_8_21_14_0_10_48_16]|uniref:Uncharacterized protein n=1 Tax=Candidatus Uhrbacteria bacterium CG10_big_fil_rev_8_21_14_0_10_48_16 TaxID=1975038 RepID=A0A2M8LHH0_9BACT|nr:MAG: hypothetical protein COV05_01665 [Candidatus Uhrbacteria bacterium CG10_big_fil_rev_8_21_14_0_10_48_16]
MEKNLMCVMWMLLVFLTGCDIAPFIGDLKTSVCDFDKDGLARSSDYCGGPDCDDGDQDVGEPTIWYNDVDQDGFGGETQETACSAPPNFVDHNGDCDDTSELVHPDAIEVCNGYDDNCDGGIDDENIPTWYADVDTDGYGDLANSQESCDEPTGYVDNSDDCDDGDATVNPEGVEICDDGIDQDCNGIIDDADGSVTWYADADGDSYGDPENLLATCVENPEGYVSNANDCDDSEADVNPSAVEICDDLIDNNCNGETDTDTEDVNWYADVDGDGYGDESDSLVDCAPPERYVEDLTDCDDADADINPGVDEVCNNDIDDNCDGSPNACDHAGTISFSTADGTIDGMEVGGYAGFALASAGDFNLDGFDDVVMSASQAHTVYIFFGPITGALDTDSADITLEGPSGSYAGMAVAGACDLDGDGNNTDILVGGPYDTDNGSEAGAVWVISGPISSGTYSLDAIADAKLTGSAGSRFGSSVDCSGDNDGDGKDDILVGAPNDDATAEDAGAVYLGISPVASGSSTSLISLLGVTTDDATGSMVTFADVDGDGYADVVIGTHQDDDVDTNAGAIAIFLGPLTSSASVSTADIKLTGENTSDFAGRTLKAGDIDGDGNDDLLVGAYQYDSSTGAFYIVYGGATLASGSLSTHIKVTGEASGDSASYGLGGICDFDRDGSNDLFIGARTESSSASQAGALYIFHGAPTSGSTLGSAYAKFTGETAGDYAGGALATMDLDGDGFCDVVTSAYLGDYTGSNTGRVYAIYGLGY